MKVLSAPQAARVSKHKLALQLAAAAAAVAAGSCLRRYQLDYRRLYNKPQGASDREARHPGDSR
jgi:hypothetical protein